MKKSLCLIGAAALGWALVGCSSENPEDLVPKAEKGNPQMMTPEAAAAGGGPSGGAAPKTGEAAAAATD